MKENKDVYKKRFIEGAKRLAGIGYAFADRGAVESLRRMETAENIVSFELTSEGKRKNEELSRWIAEKAKTTTLSYEEISLLLAEDLHATKTTIEKVLNGEWM